MRLDAGSFRGAVFALVFQQFLIVSGFGTGESAASLEDVEIQRNVSYLKSGSGDEYAQSQCLLDIYLPKRSDKPFPLLVWFHGGGLKGGSKDSAGSVRFAESLALRGVGVILVGYRLNPQVEFPAYIEDAAQSVCWSLLNSSVLNADSKVFVGGHSAGGYIAALLAMDDRYLRGAGVNIERIAGYICMSGQMMTHFTVAAERGISEKVITADDAAPIHYLRKDIPPILVLIGDNDWPARLEENIFFVSALRRVAENPKISLLKIEDRDHGGILNKTAENGDPAALAILGFMQSGKLPRDGAGLDDL